MIRFEIKIWKLLFCQQGHENWIGSDEKTGNNGSDKWWGPKTRHLGAEVSQKSSVAETNDSLCEVMVVHFAVAREGVINPKEKFGSEFTV